MHNYVCRRACTSDTGEGALEDYKVAVGAHQRGAMVECTGDLGRSGLSWVLLRARDFRIIEDPEDFWSGIGDRGGERGHGDV